MTQIRLTDLTVRALRGSAEYKTFFDTTLPAFGVRVGLRRKTFVIVRGKNRERVTIGHYPQSWLGKTEQGNEWSFCLKSPISRARTGLSSDVILFG